MNTESNIKSSKAVLKWASDCYVNAACKATRAKCAKAGRITSERMWKEFNPDDGVGGFSGNPYRADYNEEKNLDELQKEYTGLTNKLKLFSEALEDKDVTEELKKYVSENVNLSSDNSIYKIKIKNYLRDIKLLNKEIEELKKKYISKTEEFEKIENEYELNDKINSIKKELLILNKEESKYKNYLQRLKTKFEHNNNKLNSLNNDYNLMVEKYNDDIKKLKLKKKETIKKNKIVLKLKSKKNKPKPKSKNKIKGRLSFLFGGKK